MTQPPAMDSSASPQKKPFRHRPFFWGAVAVLGLFMSMALTLHFFERSLLYHPHGQYIWPGDSHAHTSLGEIGVTNARQKNQYGWYAPATTQKLTFVFFHDGADNLNTIEHAFDSFIDQGFGVLLVEYRGYGDAPGEPSEAHFYSDSEDFFDFLHEVGVKDRQMVLVGQGIGAAVATEMATRHKVASLILVSPFTSAQTFLNHRTFLRSLPVLLRDKYDNLAKIKKIQEVPVLILAGAQDALFDPYDSERLYEAAHEPKAFYAFPEGHHFDLFGPSFTHQVSQFIAPIGKGLATQDQRPKLHLEHPLPQALDLMGAPPPVSPNKEESQQPVPGLKTAPITPNKASSAVPDASATPADPSAKE